MVLLFFLSHRVIIFLGVGGGGGGGGEREGGGGAGMKVKHGQMCLTLNM